MMKRIFFVAAALLLLWLFIPTTDIVSPDWSVRITDTEGHPIEGASVSVFSQQYILESQDTEETKTTDSNGSVHFGERKIHAVGLVRLLGAIRNLDQGVHASFGVHTWIHASKPGYGDPGNLELYSENERESRANDSAQQSSHIRLLRCPPGYSGMGCSFPDDP